MKFESSVPKVRKNIIITESFDINATFSVTLTGLILHLPLRQNSGLELYKAGTYRVTSNV